MPESLTSSSFPKIIDNSMRRDFRNCERSFFYKHILRRIPPGKNADTHAGSAYAKGLEKFRNNYYSSSFHPNLPDKEREEKALILAFKSLTLEYGDFEPEGRKENKNWLNTIFALVNYFEQWPPEEDNLHPFNPEGNDPAVEFTFAIPLPINHPETGEPLLYAGRFDMLAETKQNLLVVEDDKTTGSLGMNFVNKWKLDSQVTGYVWAAEQFGHPVGGRAFIRGVALLKTQIDYIEVPCLRPKFLIDSWYKQLLFDIHRMIECWHHNYWDFDYGDSCNAYGGCPFVPLCSIPNPLDWVDNDFAENTWSPLNE